MVIGYDVDGRVDFTASYGRKVEECQSIDEALQLATKWSAVISVWDQDIDQYWSVGNDPIPGLRQWTEADTDNYRLITATRNSPRQE